MLTGLLTRLATFIAEDYETTVGAQREGPGRVARAILTWGFGLTPEAMNERSERSAAVFLAAFHHDPALLEPVRAVIAHIRRAVALDGLPSGHGGAILAACDGLFMARIFRLYTPTETEMREMHTALVRLLDGPS